MGVGTLPSAMIRCARTDNAAHNFAVLRHFVLNLIRLAPVKRKGGLKVQRLIAATSDSFRAQLLGLLLDSCDCHGRNPSIQRWY